LQVAVLNGTAILGLKNVQGLAKGANVDVSIALIALTSRSHLTFVVDYLDHVQETDETNNTRALDGGFTGPTDQTFQVKRAHGCMSRSRP